MDKKEIEGRDEDIKEIMGFMNMNYELASSVLLIHTMKGKQEKEKCKWVKVETNLQDKFYITCQDAAHLHDFTVLYLL